MTKAVLRMTKAVLRLTKAVLRMTKAVLRIAVLFRPPLGPFLAPKFLK